MSLNFFSFVRFMIFSFVCLVFSTIFVSALSLSVNLPEKYSEVVPGETFFFEIDVKYPENKGRKDLRMEYIVVNSKDEMVAQAKVLKAIETQASFIDSITIPSNVPNGIYVLNVKVSDYEDLNERISKSFSITSLESNKIMLYFYILFGVVIFVGSLVVYDLFIRKNKK